MNSSLIGKIEKAHRYAQERHRISLSSFNAEFHGENGDYVLGYDDRHWRCSCETFARTRLCSHTMAMEKILGEMLPRGTLTLDPARV